MKNPELFQKTVGILVKAYQNDTLNLVNCAACAVGNIIAANMGFICKPSIFSFLDPVNNNVLDTLWGNVIINEKFINYNDYVGKAKEYIDSTGYTPLELAKIEASFMNNSADFCGGEIFNGLMAAVDTLMQIHEATTEEAQEAKELFVKIPC